MSYIESAGHWLEHSQWIGLALLGYGYVACWVVFRAIYWVSRRLFKSADPLGWEKMSDEDKLDIIGW